MITCQACGTSNPPDAAFCSQCARKLDPATQNAVALQRAQHRATGINWSSVLTALAVLIVVGVVLALVITHIV